MQPFTAAIDEWHRRTPPADWYEGLMKVYAGSSIATDFYAECAERLRAHLAAGRSVVVIAEGLYSRSRRFVTDVAVSDLGMYFAYVTIPRREDDDRWWNWQHATKSRSVSEEAWTLLAAPAWGSGRSRLAPGCRRLTSTRPSTTTAAAIAPCTRSPSGETPRASPKRMAVSEPV